MSRTCSEMLDRLLAGSPDAIADPNPTYARLREETPVVWSGPLRSWIVTRHVDVIAGLRDQRLSARRMPALLGSVEATDAERDTILRRASTQMINSDPPEHARRRALVAAAFHPRRIESYRVRVRETADALIDLVIDRGHMDLVREFAFPLPMTILADIVGIPTTDAARVKSWADDVAGFLSSANVDAQQVAVYLRGWSGMTTYFQGRLSQPDGVEEHVVNQLAVRIAEGATTEEEALANLVLLAVAGHETTTNTIASGMLTLLHHPEQLARLRSDQSLMPSAVEEILRFVPVAQWDFRLATEDLEIDGTPIAAGQLVNFVLAAANRDPAVFEDPDHLDLGRMPNRHVTFGIGAHHCLGSQLARLELQVALEALVARLEDIELDDPLPAWKPNVRMRGLERLPIRFRAA